MRARAARYQDQSSHGSETTLYNFAGSNLGDGSGPSGGLLRGGGLLYGTTGSGGTDGAGTVFKIDPSTGTEAPLYSFLGTTHGDGEVPSGTLTNAGNFLYGTTEFGGTNGHGTVFKVTLKTGKETILYNFTGGIDGYEPNAGLVNVGAFSYGTTCCGGGSQGVYNGSLFRITRAPGNEATLYDFSGGNASDQTNGLLSVGGFLYGTTYWGGSQSFGALFKVNRTTGAETTLYSFTGGPNGKIPDGLIYVAGAFYGTAAIGASQIMA
jgi:uncharacterized repeat protein (TIGR03803 family)